MKYYLRVEETYFQENDAVSFDKMEFEFFFPHCRYSDLLPSEHREADAPAESFQGQRLDIHQQSEPTCSPKKSRQEPPSTAANIFIMNECEKRESDAPAEPYRASTGRPQARGAVFAAANSSARTSPASPSRPVFSLVKTLIKMF